MQIQHLRKSQLKHTFDPHVEVKNCTAMGQQCRDKQLSTKKRGN